VDALEADAFIPLFGSGETNLVVSGDNDQK
jgi:hypothetical protein